MLEEKDLLTVPKHIAFIMDGNRRWAVKNGLERKIGHKIGAENWKKVIKCLLKFDEIKYASFFAFSTENWNRKQEEIDYIFDVVGKMCEESEEEFVKNNIKLHCMGDLSRFPASMQEKLFRVMERTKDATGLVVNLALNYGGRDDIVHAVNKVIEKGGQVTVDSIKENLYSYPSPDVDLVVRTSGEKRISNFMLFQMAYSELYFTDTYWPEFNQKELEKALLAFSKRNRRFGGK